MMDRRQLAIGLCGAAIAPAGAWAQSAGPKGKIGYVHPVTIDPAHITFSILQKAWRRLGYVDGKDVVARSARDDPRRLPTVVAEVIGEGANVLIVVGADAVRSAARATSTVPIVAIDLETDPVRTGLISSYSRPGGNVTGLFLDLPSLATKWIELLREAAPGLDRIALVWDRSTGTDQLDIAIDIANKIGIEVVSLAVRPSDNFESEFAKLSGPGKTGIVQLTFPGISTVAAGYAAAAEKHKLPTIAFLRVVAHAGVLMSYGPSQEHYFPRAVELADKILNGANVGEIPIERPAKFEFVVNLKTAQALGLTLPPSILVRADEVIE